MKPNYKVNMVMNNNVVLAMNLENKNEVILLGKGIGFGKKKDQTVYYPKDVIERSFINVSQTLKADYYNLIQQMDLQVMGVCQEIILMAEKAIGELNDSIHIVLTDHIGFAIERIKQNMVIENPFLDEIKVLYGPEFELAKEALNRINESIEIILPEEEAGFIALHLHSARKNLAVKTTLKNTKAIKKIIEFLEGELGTKVIQDNLNYRRLLTHLRGGIERVEQGIHFENPLLSTIKKDFKEAWRIAEKVRDMIQAELNLKIEEDEIGYLCIHIDRLLRLKS